MKPFFFFQYNEDRDEDQTFELKRWYVANQCETKLTQYNESFFYHETIIDFRL